MTRTGKIARLPHDIREQLNARLRSGEQGKTLLQWLNALPEAIAILAANFTGHPFTPANLTEWKRGGYQDWLVRQDALDLVHTLRDPLAFGEGLLADSLPKSATPAALSALPLKPLSGSTASQIHFDLF